MNRLSPDEIEELVARDPSLYVKFKGEDAIEEEMYTSQLSLPSRSGGGVKEGDLACLHEYFEDVDDDSHEITLDETSVDFGKHISLG